MERHSKIGNYVKDMIFGANDGIVTTFAVIAGVVGASLSSNVIIIIGIANLLADGFSMATGNYLGTKSERDLYAREKAIEEKEIETIPEKEKLEVREILERKGYHEPDLTTMTNLVTSNTSFWVDFMMNEELELFEPINGKPLKHATVTFFSFVIAGSIPLLPYFLLQEQAFFLKAIILTAIALFLVGAVRAKTSRRHWFLSGLEMLFVGGSAAALAYAVGAILQRVI